MTKSFATCHDLYHPDRPVADRRRVADHATRVIKQNNDQTTRALLSRKAFFVVRKARATCVIYYHMPPMQIAHAAFFRCGAGPVKVGVEIHSWNWIFGRKKFQNWKKKRKIFQD
jgi:hypothetical protein